MLFHYYDSRVFHTYLPTCTLDEVQTVFGPIKGIIIEGEKALLYRLQYSEQGSKAIFYIVRNQKHTKAFLVKNWNFVGAGSYASPWSHIFHSECVVLPGVPGQRNPNPSPVFFNHFIVIHGGKFYDPPYGGLLPS